jgi:hypothetical protein
MSEPARYDPPVQRFKPDAELVSRAQRFLMGYEDSTTSRVRFIRQRWEEALGATRVAMDALREIYPVDADALEPTDQKVLSVALSGVTTAYMALDRLSRVMLGEVMHDVLVGRITTQAELDALGVPK